MTNEERYKTAANRELHKLAVQGMGNFHGKRNLLAQRSELELDWCEDLILGGPDTCLINTCNCPRHGVFAGMNAREILLACFDSDAVVLLLESAGNKYQFWHILHRILLIGENGYGSPLPMPVSHSETQRLLDLIKIKPFGFTHDCDTSPALLEKRLAEGFDVDKLDPVYAAELLDIGFLLLHIPGPYGAARHLVISPLFRNLVTGYRVPEGILE